MGYPILEPVPFQNAHLRCHRRGGLGVGKVGAVAQAENVGVPGVLQGLLLHVEEPRSVSQVLSTAK